MFLSDIPEALGDAETHRPFRFSSLNVKVDRLIHVVSMTEVEDPIQVELDRLLIA